MNLPLLKKLLLALAAGDSLGSTSEFTPQNKMPALFHDLRETAWPFKQIGGGAFKWPAGAPTDDTDMALAIARSAVAMKRFDGQDIAERFVSWIDTAPHDVGRTTRTAIEQISSGTPWHQGGRSIYFADPANAANGSLMRNGVIPAIADSADHALTLSVLHSLITHYAPLPVLCCAAQTWLITEALAGRDWLESDWPDHFLVVFSKHLDQSHDENLAQWKSVTAAAMPEAMEIFGAARFGADRFDPFSENYSRRSGYCVLTLQIAVWGAAWAARKRALPTPTGFPHEVFSRTGGWTLSWVAMIGHDSDTYAATAGPLIAAVAEIPRELIDGLQINREVNAWQ